MRFLQSMLEQGSRHRRSAWMVSKAPMYQESCHEKSLQPAHLSFSTATASLGLLTVLRFWGLVPDRRVGARAQDVYISDF